MAAEQAKGTKAPEEVAKAPEPCRYVCCLSGLGGSGIEVTACSEQEAAAEFRKLAPLCDKSVEVSVTKVG